MLKNRINIISKLYIFFDIIAIAGAFAFTYYFRIYLKKFYGLDIFPGKIIMGPLQPIDRYLGLLLFVIPIWVIILFCFGIYDLAKNRSFGKMVYGVIKSLVLGTLILCLYVILLKIDYIGRSFLLLFPPICFVFILLDKIILLKLIHFIPKGELYYHNMIIVGTGERARKFCKIIENHANWDLRIKGFIDMKPELVGTRIDGYEVKGTLKDIENIIKNEVVDEVVFVLPRKHSGGLGEVFHICEREGIKVYIAGDLFYATHSKISTTEIDGIPLIVYETISASIWQLFIKRIIDIVISFLLLVLLSFPFLIIVILIKISSKGSVLFSQVRCTKNGRKFNLYKFRTMIQDAEGVRESLSHLNESTGPAFKIEEDPRLVKSTKFMRKFSLDELPQLYNVLIGDLSLVGPRPLPLVDEKYEMGQRRRLSMKSGLTCLWQVKGRNDIAFNKWMELDQEYIDNWSLWLDFKILFKTILVVLSGKGK